MTIRSKMLWFVLSYVFIHCFGNVDVELFVVVNFIIAFFIVYNKISQLTWFDTYINWIRDTFIRHRELVVFMFNVVVIVLEKWKYAVSQLFLILLIQILEFEVPVLSNKMLCVTDNNIIKFLYNEEEFDLGLLSQVDLINISDKTNDGNGSF